MGKLVDAARAYLGVKWRHRGRTRNSLDCAGLIVIAFADCGVETDPFIHYGREPFEDGLVKRTRASLGAPLPISTPLQDGDVILLRFAKHPHHMGIVAAADYGGTAAFNIIHADGLAGRVIEQRLAPEMIERITHIFRRAVS